MGCKSTLILILHEPYYHFLVLLYHLKVSKTLSVDSTCIDRLLSHHTPQQFMGFHTSLLRSLFEQDLQITRDVFKKAAFESQEGLAVLAQVRYESFTSPFLDDSELLEAIVLKSDHQLQEFFHQPKYLYALNADTIVNALIMSTVTGWMDGCRVLLNANLVGYLEDPDSELRYFGQTLLMLSAATNRPDMLQFWLSQRETHDGPLLKLIGHFEDALHFHWIFDQGTPDTDVIPLVSSYLLKQRHEVKLLMEKHNIPHCCERARTGFPDAHVVCILSALVTAGIHVPQRYWPIRKSLYYMPQMWMSDKLLLFESLELAGICDISQENFKCDKETSCSPLVYLATQVMEGTGSIWSMCLTERSLTVRWFLSRGANMRETWPGTAITALHCLAWQSAECLSHQVFRSSYDDSPIMEEFWTYEDYEFLVKEEILDQCECGCSRFGCDFLSCFWKEMYAADCYCPQFPLLCDRFKNTLSARELGKLRVYALDDYAESRYELFTGTFLDLTLWVDRAASTLDLSRLIHDYIRLFVFSYLEIQHTCCDITRISRYRENPDSSEQPYPRYSPKELRRITNEDAHLRARLEQLVPELITRHDSFGGNLQDFVIDVLTPTMRRTAKGLKEEDKTLYATGRREMGVVMDEYEDETEGGSSEVEEEETDAEEESDDEY